MLVEIDDKIVSGDLFTDYFVCDLSKCKGACCVEGVAGAPLQKNEAELLAQNFDKISKCLPKWVRFPSNTHPPD